MSIQTDQYSEELRALLDEKIGPAGSPSRMAIRGAAEGVARAFAEPLIRQIAILKDAYQTGHSIVDELRVDLSTVTAERDAARAEATSMREVEQEARAVYGSTDPQGDTYQIPPRYQVDALGQALHRLDAARANRVQGSKDS